MWFLTVIARMAVIVEVSMRREVVVCFTLLTLEPVQELIREIDSLK